MNVQFTAEEMNACLVRYSDLVPCTTAFIDTRTPGSDRKENFTIIGPGVSESPEQHVHIRTPHGFNIGGARQPPGCINSQHSHKTEEVFVIHTGEWRFTTGHDGSGPHVDLRPGDTISIPTGVFRGFQNIGSSVGFMFAVLGKDDPGRVTWAPSVFTEAEKHGLILLESGQLIDTTKHSAPVDAPRMRATTAADVLRHRSLAQEDLEGCVLRYEDLQRRERPSAVSGLSEVPIIGPNSSAEGMPEGKMAWRHGFHLRALSAAEGARSGRYQRFEAEVLLMHRGCLRFDWAGGSIDLGPGDTLTVPQGLEHGLSNPGSDATVCFVVRGGDQPQAPVIAAA